MFLHSQAVSCDSLHRWLDGCVIKRFHSVTSSQTHVDTGALAHGCHVRERLNCNKILYMWKIVVNPDDLATWPGFITTTVPAKNTSSHSPTWFCPETLALWILQYIYLFALSYTQKLTYYIEYFQFWLSLHKYSVALENPLYFCVQMVFLVAVGLHNRNTVTVKTCQQHQTIKYITQTGFPSPVPLRGTYILCLVCCTGQRCIIKPLLLNWHIALHRFHESFMSTEWCSCQFEGHISTNFGQVADSASMIKNLGDGLKVRGLKEANCDTQARMYYHTKILYEQVYHHIL